MAVVCQERPRQSTESHYLRPGGSREYVISGTRDKLTAQLAIINTAPNLDTGLDSDGNEVPIFLDHISIKEEGGGIWIANVKYESSTDTTDLQFTFGATTTKIYQALEHIGSYDCIHGGSVEDTNLVAFHNGVIGVNGDEVEGVDIESSIIEFTITKKRYRATLPADYFQTLIDIMDLRTPVNDGTRVIKGQVAAQQGQGGGEPGGLILQNPIAGDAVADVLAGNNAIAGAAAADAALNLVTVSDPFVFIWKGLRIEFPEGSLRLRGIPIKWTSSNEVEISYHFAYQRPITLNDDFRIGESDAIIKEGWEYGWISYRLGTSNGAPTRTPESFNVEKVYPKRNFNVLDL